MKKGEGKISSEGKLYIDGNVSLSAEEPKEKLEVNGDATEFKEKRKKQEEFEARKKAEEEEKKKRRDIEIQRKSRITELNKKSELLEAENRYYKSVLEYWHLSGEYAKIQEEVEKNKKESKVVKP